MHSLWEAIKPDSSGAMSLFSDYTPEPFRHLPVVVRSPNNNNKHRLEFLPKRLKTKFKPHFSNSVTTATLQTGVLLLVCLVWGVFLVFFLLLLKAQDTVSCGGKPVVDTMSREQDSFPIGTRWWKLFNHQIRMCNI